MKRLVLAMALMAAPPVAQATELSYSYFEAGYFFINPDGFSGESGWGLRGSAAVSESFHLLFGYDQVSLGRGRDLDLWRFGLGYNHALSDRTDLVARVAFESIDGDSGWNAEVGVRGAFSPHFDGFAGIGYSEFSRGSGDGYLVLQGHARFNPKWGIAAEAKVFDGGHTIFVGPRASF